MENKQLQKEAQQRLNVMVDELRNSQNADLSAKNLGEEGCIYISEGLAFNDRWPACSFLCYFISASQMISEAFWLFALSQPWHLLEHMMAVCGIFRQLHAALCGAMM